MRCTAFLFFSLFISFDVSASECGRHSPSSYLYSDIDPIEYIRTHHAQDLTELHQSDGTVLGLAGGPIGTRLEVVFEAEPYQGQLFCLKAKKIEATFFAQPTVYIARNFGRGSCEYNAVLRHEMKHVNELKKAFHEYTPRYQSRLYEISQTLPELEPVSLQGINDQKQGVVNYVGAEMRIYQDEITSELAARQQDIDTQQEYQRVQSVCHRWDKKLEDE